MLGAFLESMVCVRRMTRAWQCKQCYTMLQQVLVLASMRQCSVCVLLRRCCPGASRISSSAWGICGTTGMQRQASSPSTRCCSSTADTAWQQRCSLGQRRQQACRGGRARLGASQGEARGPGRRHRCGAASSGNQRLARLSTCRAGASAATWQQQPCGTFGECQAGNGSLSHRAHAGGCSSKRSATAQRRFQRTLKW